MKREKRQTDRQTCIKRDREGDVLMGDRKKAESESERQGGRVKKRLKAREEERQSKSKRDRQTDKGTNKKREWGHIE